MGAYTPHFESKPDEYYEAGWCDILAAITMMLLIIVFFVGVSVAIVEWVVNLGSVNFTLTWSIIVIVFIVFFVIATFFGSRHRESF